MISSIPMKYEHNFPGLAKPKKIFLKHSHTGPRNSNSSLTKSRNLKQLNLKKRLLEILRLELKTGKS